MDFIIKWIISYVLIMFALSVDNIFWISSSPEYQKFKRLGWFRFNEAYDLFTPKKRHYTKIGYIFNYRIKSVLTDWRDITPGIMTSFILALIW